MIYHPKFNPPPPEVVPRLSWRTDDTPDTLARRLQVYREKTRPIYGPSPIYPPAPATVTDIPPTHSPTPHIPSHHPSTHFVCCAPELYRGRHFVVDSAKNELEVLQDINDVLYKVRPPVRLRAHTYTHMRVLSSSS